MTSVRQQVEEFARQMVFLDDTRLNEPWNWKGYEEGLRFIFFRVYEELRQAAAMISAPQTTVQRRLVQHHLSFCNLQAVLLGFPDYSLDNEPAPGEWSVRKTLTHIVETEWTFYGVFHWNLTHRSTPTPIPDNFWDPFFKDHGGFNLTTFTGSLADSMSFFSRVHGHIIKQLSLLPDQDLNFGMIFWEDEPMPLRFRLGRFDSHLRQHTIQIEKTMTALGIPLTEARQLMIMVYSALGELEGRLIGHPEINISLDLSDYLNLAHFI